MQRFLVEEVELDRCPFCGGLWFDRGELESIAGRKLAVEPLAGHTTRRCAYCGITLGTALLEATPAEVCGSCLGTYLDDGELEELARRKVPFPRGDAAQAGRREAVQVQCCGCARALPLGEGMATPRGLSCGGCYGRMDYGGGAPLAVGHSLRYDNSDGAWLVAEAFWALFD